MNKILKIIILNSVLTSCQNPQRYENEIKKAHFYQILGVYKIDLARTSLGSYYNDSCSISKLVLTFEPDSTFNFNMRVPFLLDTFGTWNTCGSSLWELNQFRFRSAYYPSNSGEQFTQIFASSGDSFIIINSVTPRKSAEHLPVIYFKKLRTLSFVDTRKCKLSPHLKVRQKDAAEAAESISPILLND